MIYFASRLAGRVLSPGGQGARLSILIYHRVLAAPDPLFATMPTLTDFELQMRVLQRQFNVIPLCDAIEGLKRGALPERPACVTFDDGYADNAEIALPILSRLGIPAAFFIATDYLDGGVMWNDVLVESVRETREPVLDLRGVRLGILPVQTLEQRRDVVRGLLTDLKYRSQAEREHDVAYVAAVAGVGRPTNLMMSSGQVMQLRRAGMEIGGHTASHPILSSLEDDAVREEILRGKHALEHITGERIRYFAYPNGKRGDFSEKHAEMLRAAGFEAALTTANGVATRDTDLYHLPRFAPWDKDGMRYAVRMTQNLLRAPTQAAHPH